ncbi:MAG: DUF1549 and DUF1553 domain-containing protein [Chthoniobacteraceae bacterium]
MKRPFLHALAVFTVAAACLAASGNGAGAEKTDPPLWSLQPVVKPPLPTVKQSDWPVARSDHFILAEMEKNGLRPSADADAATMLRRLSFDLIGLPPSLAEIAVFEKEWSQSPPDAIAHAADRLLASPEFGPRWGRHWLDVARYAESSGNSRNMAYVLAWRYRNWVVDEFNKNTPFNKFIRQQIAGDLLPAARPEERDENLLGTGFLTVGVKSLGEQDVVQYELNIADDQIDATTRAFLGLTVSCARCHDHKFDPIPTRDYYALAGIFRSTSHLTGVETNNRKEEADGMALGPDGMKRNAAVKEHAKQLADMTKEYTDTANKRKTMRDELTKAGIEPTKAKPAEMPPAMAEKLATLVTLDKSVADYQTRLKEMKEKAPVPPPLGMAVQDKPKPVDSPLYYKGDAKKPQDAVPRGGISALAVAFRAVPPGESGRRELADWIAAPENPLTGRVIVNRLWQHLFGRGIVETPDDFGDMGTRPTHPALLDDLAFRFVREGWNVKALIRELVTSRAYRMSSQSSAVGAQKDPTNTLLWRMNRKPLEAEPLRDALLELGGTLDRAQLIGSQVATRSEPITPQGRELGRRGLFDEVPDEPTRRSIYLPVLRAQANPAMQCFDVADPNLVIGQRRATIVPAQALFLMNSEMVMKQAQGLAARLLAEPGTPDARIAKAWRMCFTREPSANEAKLLHATIAATPDDPAVWTRVCQTLMMKGEFRILE